MSSGVGTQRSSQTQRVQQQSPQQSRQPRRQNLQIPNLPRYHPANLASSHLNTQTDPNVLLSPGKQREQQQKQRQASEAQRQLYLHQRELMRMIRPPRSPSLRNVGPGSPHLMPLGSPGPVTPLELEEQDSYFVTGTRSPGLSDQAQDEVLEAFNRNEAKAAQNQQGGQSMTQTNFRPARSPGHRSNLSK